MTTDGSDRGWIGWAGLAVLLLLAAGIAVLISDPLGAADPASKRPPLTRLEARAAGIEERLDEQANNTQLLLATARAWIEAGDEALHQASVQDKPIPGAVQEDFKAGLRAWDRYLQQTGGKAGANIAQLAGETHFILLELGSRDLTEIEANAAGAAQGLRIAGREWPNVYSLSHAAIYEYFNGEFTVGDRTGQRAAADVPKASAREVFRQLREYRRRAEFFRGQLKEAAQELRETGGDQLQEPLKAFSFSGNINKENPARESN